MSVKSFFTKPFRDSDGNPINVATNTANIDIYEKGHGGESAYLLLSNHDSVNAEGDLNYYGSGIWYGDMRMCEYEIWVDGTAQGEGGGYDTYEGLFHATKALLTHYEDHDDSEQAARIHHTLSQITAYLKNQIKALTLNLLGETVDGNDYTFDSYTAMLTKIDQIMKDIKDSVPDSVTLTDLIDDNSKGSDKVWSAEKLSNFLGDTEELENRNWLKRNSSIISNLIKLENALDENTGEDNFTGGSSSSNTNVEYVASIHSLFSDFIVDGTDGNDVSVSDFTVLEESRTDKFHKKFGFSFKKMKGYNNLTVNLLQTNGSNEYPAYQQIIIQDAKTETEVIPEEFIIPPSRGAFIENRIDIKLTDLNNGDTYDVFIAMKGSEGQDASAKIKRVHPRLS